MPPRLAVITPPGVEPLTSAEAKLFAKIDTTADDAVVTDLIKAARQRCESHSDLAFNNQTLECSFDDFPDWAQEGILPYGRTDVIDPPFRLPRSPLVSVTSITYYLATGGSFVVSPSDYQVDTTSWPGLVTPNIGKAWPRDQMRATAGVVVRYVSGFGANATDVPQHLRLALEELVAFWYDYRDTMPDVPPHIEALLNEPWTGFAYA